MVKAGVSVTNYLSNPNAEGSYVPWSYYTATLSLNTSQYYSGTKSVKVDVPVQPSERPGGLIWMSQAAIVPKGSTVYCSFWFLGPTGGNFKVMSRYSNNGVNYEGAGGTISFVATGSWQKITVNSYVAANGANATCQAGFEVLAMDTYLSVNIPTIFYVDQAIASNSNVDYYDGTSPGWSWTGTAIDSPSTGPVFMDKTLKVCNITNYTKYPNFTGTGTVADGWFNYVGGGTTYVGTKSASGGAQTITATTLSGGNRRSGMGLVGANEVRNLYVEAGEMIYIACDVDLSGLAAGTQFGLYAEPRDPVSGTLAYPETTTTSGTRSELRWAVPAGKTVTAIPVYIWIKSPADWTGTSTVVVSNLIVMKQPTYNGSFTYPYFDGNTANCEWTGTVNASSSVKKEWAEYKMKVWNGTAWINQ